MVVVFTSDTEQGAASQTSEVDRAAIPMRFGSSVPVPGTIQQPDCSH